MTGLAPAVQLLWALNSIAQLTLLGLLIHREHYRKLPFFTAYVALDLLEAACLWFVYIRYGFYSPTALSLAWILDAFTLVVRAFAIVEIFRLVLKPYRGIWGLAWRLLTTASTAVLLYAVLDSGWNMRSALFTAERGVQLAFAVALVGLLLLARYYSVPVRPAYKALLGGFCFYSCAVVLTNTLLEPIFASRSAYYESIWNAATLLAYLAAQVVWIAALRSPLPAVVDRPVLLPVSVYDEVTPLVHARLRLLNDRLASMFRA
jgi:hypothetical protein